MCGIVSYIGSKSAKEILIEGLKTLEYRGYDSSGIALLDSSNQISIHKTPGKIAELEKELQNKQAPQATCGIGHTRWATHGEPNQTNAHPHKDNSGYSALVHNGIIKNFHELKAQLIQRGVELKTDTDSEVVAQLFAQQRQDSPDDVSALRQTLKLLEGSYALALLTTHAGEPKILVAKNQSPLVIGYGEDEKFIASDSTTVLQFTNKIIRLADGQIAEITAKEVKVEDLEGNKIKLEVHHMQQINSILEKGPHKHFLIKEIHEQPAVISKMLDQAISAIDKPVQIFEDLDFDLKKIQKITFIACGTAFYSGLVAKFLLENWAKIKTEVIIASEYCDTPALVDDSDLVIGISQSGETADTLAAITNAKKHGANVMAITNREDSALAELCKPNVYTTPAGIEVSVASTKAFSSQVMTHYLLALKFVEAKDITKISGLSIPEIKSSLRTLPLVLDQVIERASGYREQFLKYSSYHDFLFLSRGINYPIALEGALKLKELSYIHATGYPSGEMKHGPIAILDHNVPVLSIAVNGETEIERHIYQKTLLNAEEARARKSPSLVVACDDNKEVESIFDEVIRIPNISQLFSPIIAVIPLQFLAYYIAEELGKDVDQPRNLAKSVTVE